MKNAPPPDLLTTHARWLRGLARALVRDPADAEDLVQEGLLAALTHPPDRPGAVRGWLRTVLRNRARNAARTRRRRAAREAAAEAPDDVATPERIVATLALQRRVAELVAELREPYRQVLHLRFFEERDSPEIARLLGIPEGTVRWRLKAALDELRARLDAEEKQGRAWRAILVMVASDRNEAADGLFMPRPKGTRRRWLRTAVVSGAALTTVIATLALMVPKGRRRRATEAPNGPSWCAGYYGRAGRPSSRPLSRLGGCIVQAIRAEIAAFPMPPTRDGLTAHARLQLPTATHPWTDGDYCGPSR